MSPGCPPPPGLVEHAGNVATRDAPAVAAMRAAGAILIGKTNVAEGAALLRLAQPALRSDAQPARPRARGGRLLRRARPRRSLRAMSPWGLGSDLGSSIRNPAHFTGIFGLLPSVGDDPCDRELAARTRRRASP